MKESDLRRQLNIARAATRRRREKQAETCFMGYVVRAVLMPIIPVPGRQDVYTGFLERPLPAVPLQPITLGRICSYRGALTLMETKLGKGNSISRRLDRRRSADGRVRFPLTLRVQVCRYLIDCIRRIRPDLDIGLCLEDHGVLEALNLRGAVGRCNCVV